ncbi:SIALI-17 repeat-containing surface protein [Streptococcus parasanguinis]|uniref:SIALI-17 repeat-containing surface protein n=1 Tax=Streptococcus parasanguinis TaxID=1318 RepID=UPI00068B8236|nr:SIALI-17 repeat-containing surface protein [Streptococcus parasanguinis]
MNKKVILTTVATIAAIATAGGVKADEFNGDLAKDSIGLTAETGNSANGTEATVSNAQGEHTGDLGSVERDRAVNEEDPSRGSNAESVTKDGDTIRVENPKVVIEQPEGNGRYTPFKVKYEDIKIPDNIEVNEGDKVTFDLPEEVKFQTSYEFDVHNPEKAVVGKATADATTNKVTTVFNDYFKSHPLNKSMSLELDASWTDKVVPGKPVTANFNGTLVTANVGSEGVIGKDELIAKWGSQDKEDPTVINWTARVNYAKKVLNYVTIIDEMSENQKLVDNYFEIKNIESLNPWVDKGSAMDLVKSISKSDHGFEIKMDRLDHMVYLYYKTKLVNAVKDSTNPTNKIELKAENDGAVSYQKIQLVGGKGDAIGENKTEPTFEIPKESPKVEIPEFEGGIPGIPEVREKPEYTEPIGTVPNDSPVLDKPEWKGGTVPFDAPQLDKPEWKGGVTPPDSPVLEKPELVIDIPDPKRDEPKPQPKQDKPNTPAPKTETKKETVEVVNQGEVKQNEPVETYSAPAVLPATGSNLGLSLVALGISVATLAFVLKKNKK